MERHIGTCLACLVVLSALFLTGCTSEEKKEPRSTAPTSTSTTKKEEPRSTAPASTTEKEEPRDIKASVSFDGTQFTITNKESRDWTNVRFEINPGIFSSGYTYKTARIKAGTTYTVGAMQFTDSEGERFNPFLKKPKSFIILEFARPWPDQYEIEGMASFGWQ